MGAAALYAYDPEMSRQQSGRPFTVAATVRGFYDDNINTSPDKQVVITSLPGGGSSTNTIDPREGSFGFQVSPSIHWNIPLEQTFISLGYVYGFTWYDNREPDNYDQSHDFNLKLRHQFSPRHQISVDDSFVLTSEPTVVDQSSGIITSPVKTRTDSSVLHNYGAIEDNIGLTRSLALSLGYNNNWYDYEADGVGSRSALLDRLEHLIRADARYQINPKLVGIVGYTFGLNSFTDDEFIEEGSTLKSDSRDSMSHYVYAGVDYDITAKLRTTLRLGAQFSEYDELNESSQNPYADLSLSYMFRLGTSIEVGARHMRNATDVSAVDTSTGLPTLDAETTSAYIQFHHNITHALVGSLTGQYQHSVFFDGLNDGDTEDLWLFGVNLSYTFNRHWSAEIGYNFDTLDSNLTTGDRSYDRNRAYIGVTARY